MGYFFNVYDEMIQNLKYRDSLIRCQEKVFAENPDRLEEWALGILGYKISKEIETVEQGLPKHLRKNNDFPNVPEFEECEEYKVFSRHLFEQFVDWYGLAPTPSNNLLNFILKRYPLDIFPRILCVGDGAFCHLGRKLALNGYNVMSMDPEINTNSIHNEDKFHFLDREFSLRSSEDIIRWASLVVGSKVPECAEMLLNCPKPTAFSIGANPEIYHMKFNGELITSYNQFDEMIRRTPGVTTYKTKQSNPLEGVFHLNIYTHDGRKKEHNKSDDEIEL